MKSSLFLAALLVAVPGAGFAQQAETGQPPQRIRSVQLTEGQKCPESTGDEVIVCSRAGEPYRIPPALRDTGPVSVPNSSWAARAADGEQTQRVAAGLPNTCSPNGVAAQSGCSLQANRRWAAEQRAKQAAERVVP